MKFLLFFLWISFFFLFFLFSGIERQDAFFQNIFLQAQLYVIISLICVSRVFSFSTVSKNSEDGKKRKSIFSKYSFSRADFTEYTKLFFGEYIYYIGTLLFYISLFLILKTLLWGIDIPVIFLCFNILVSSLYFFQNKFPLFQDFIRINTLVVSLFYSIKNLEYLLGSWVWMWFIDSVNILFIFLLFFFFFTSSKRKNYLWIFCSYALVFIFLQLLTVYKSIFWGTLLWFSFLAFIFWFICLSFTQNIAQILTLRRWNIRIWGLVCLYIFTLCSPFYIFQENLLSFVFLIFSWCAAFFLFKFHERFQNYISLFFSSFSVSCIALGIYGMLVPEAFEYTYIFILFFLLSGVFLLWDRLSHVTHLYDKYFFRSFSIVVNLIWVICFLYFIEVSILKLAFLLFGECLYFFYSYYTLRNENIPWYISPQNIQK